MSAVHRVPRWVYWLLLSTWAAFSVTTRGSEEAPPRQTDLSEEVRVQLVQLPILALDRQGRPVVDLKPEEIEVKDRGRTMRVAYLERFRQSGGGPAPLPQVRLYLDAPGGWQEPVTSHGSGAGYVMFLVDVENDPPLRKEEAIEALMRFARSELAPDVRAAVAAFDGDLHLDLPFTANREALAAALMRAWSRTPQPSVDLSARMRQLLSRFEDCIVGGTEFVKQADERCLRDVVTEYADQVRPRAERFMKALEGLIQYLGGLRARKTVVAVSHGVAAEPTIELLEAMRGVFGNSEQMANIQLYLGFGDTPRLMMDKVLQLAVENKVTLHVVDRTLAPTGDFGASRSAALAPGTSPMRAAYTAAQDDMEEIAVTSGGVFVSSTEVYSGLKQVLDTEAGGYELGYYLDEIPDDERLRKVKVTAKRKGVRIRHRRAYPVRLLSESIPLKGQIVLGPLETADEDLPSRHPFDIEVDPKSIGYKADGDGFSANFVLHFTVRDLQGRVLADSYHFVNHTYPREIWEKGEAAPVRIHGWVEVDPGAYTLTALFRNLDNGREGELQNAIEVLPGGEP